MRRNPSNSRHDSSDTRSTQEQALDHIMELALLDGYVHDLLLVTALRPVASLCDNPERWCNSTLSVQAKSRKALETITDSKINYLLEKSRFLSRDLQVPENMETLLIALNELEEYIWCVSPSSSYKTNWYNLYT